MERGLEHLNERISSLEQTLAERLDRLRDDVAAGRTIAEETRDLVSQLREELTLARSRRRSRAAA